MTAPTLDPTAAAEHFFSGAQSAGLSHVVLSPGSRSTPLAIAVSRSPGLSYSLHLDERSAAFAALGRAKSTGLPVGLVCTSGTAAANYLPAISEASLSNIPLVVITADRPPEDQRWGVGQSFDQRGLYHRQVREEITMPVGGDGGEAFSLRAGWRAAATSIERQGPVHVNWGFRMPLEPTSPPIGDGVDLGPAQYRRNQPTKSDIATMIGCLERASSPLVVAGPDTLRPHRHRSEAARLTTALAELGIPVLADCLSGLRGADGRSAIEAPALVTSSAVPASDLIIHLGNTPTSKSTRLWWETLDAEHVLLDPLDDWQDPSHGMTSRLPCDPIDLLNEIAVSGAVKSFSDDWCETWLAAGRRTAERVIDVLESTPITTEAHVARDIGVASADADRIVASSSMPIRDIDTFTSIDCRARVFANRGINGIDGVVSTAIGVQAAATAGRTVVHLGDVAALHDVGGILDAARQGTALTVVIPNNDGGGIFSLLPIRAAIGPDTFDELFHTPHGTTFDFLGGLEGVTHVRTTDLASALDETSGAQGVSIVEVPVDTESRLQLHDTILSAIAEL
ncbi:MAG: 2-succinyl-5-enolpyruvyl-6-hydroxy-3-cyclohexene-1-carboxylate synthase [Verrucomicrobiales bacterium]|jgi:2-succinyl-5-enolpyruvyl-6-hydroxy-3-cyclohexene-1-carboxylate synthase